MSPAHISSKGLGRAAGTCKDDNVPGRVVPGQGQEGVPLLKPNSHKIDSSQSHLRQLELFVYRQIQKGLRYDHGIHLWLGVLLPRPPRFSAVVGYV